MKLNPKIRNHGHGPGCCQGLQARLHTIQAQIRHPWQFHQHPQHQDCPTPTIQQPSRLHWHTDVVHARCNSCQSYALHHMQRFVYL